MTEAYSTSSFFSCQISTVCSDFRWKKRDAFRHIQLQHSALGILIYDVWWYGIHICYFVSPYKSSQGLIGFWFISIFSLFPHWELKSVHFLSLPTSSLIRPTAENSFLISCHSRSFDFGSSGPSICCSSKATLLYLLTKQSCPFCHEENSFLLLLQST